MTSVPSLHHSCMHNTVTESSGNTAGSSVSLPPCWYDRVPMAMIVRYGGNNPSGADTSTSCNVQNNLHLAYIP
jgi:hypothetical protein